MFFPNSDCRFRYANFILCIILMCTLAVFIVLLQNEILPATEIYRPDFGNSWFIQWLKVPPDKISIFHLNLENHLFTVDRKFLSFSIDSSQIYHGLINPSLNDRKLRKIVSHLSGGYLRIGGKAADLLVFTPSHRAWPANYLSLDGGECTYDNRNCPISVSRTLKKFSMSAKDWVDINEFAKSTGLKLLFNLNVLLRTNASWDTSNAELLLDFSYAHQYDVDWELGNEPNSFLRTFGLKVEPESLAADFSKLRKLLQLYALYNSSLIVGPDVTRPKHLQGVNTPSEIFLQRFLSGNPPVDAVTWHHYYLGPQAKLEEVLNPETYDKFSQSCQIMMEAVKKTHTSKPVWLGEAGSAYGGGALNISDKFVSSLLWLDKLGVAAKHGISLIVRQSLYRGHYSLLDEYTLEPNPDFWITVLYKKLVHREVLNISYVGKEDDGKLRVYAHCSEKSKAVLFGVNIANITQGISLDLNISGSFYSFTGAPNLLSRGVNLNGELLYLNHEMNLPQFVPVIVTMESPVSIPPYSIFFLQLHLKVPFCTEK